MSTNSTSLTMQDFSNTEFPEFFDDHIIEEVLNELNTILLESAIETGSKPSSHHDLRQEPQSPSHLINVLRNDILTSPYLYFSNSLIDKIRKS